MTDRLDTLRTENPELGFAIYAMEPGGPVTLEVHTPDGQVFTFTGRTAGVVMGRAFPPLPPEPDEPPAASHSIFD
jgi:hypothetical protein